jgi:hypothetical protein
MSDAPHIIYTPRPDATPAGEIAALASAYSFLIEKHQERKKGGPATAPDDAEKESQHDRAKNIIPDRT